MGQVFSCPECGKMVATIFPMHICEPTEEFKSRIEARSHYLHTLAKITLPAHVPIGAAPSAIMQETGHETMLDRVKAFHRMLTALTPDWEEWLETMQHPDERPRWIREAKDQKFFADMLLTFDSANIEDISITKKQFFWMRDIYDRSL